MNVREAHQPNQPLIRREGGGRELSWRSLVAVFLLIAVVAVGFAMAGPDRRPAPTAAPSAPVSTGDKFNSQQIIETCTRNTPRARYTADDWVDAVNHCIADTSGVSYDLLKKAQDANSR